jgi:hypothetical protein
MMNPASDEGRPSNGFFRSALKISHEGEGNRPAVKRLGPESAMMSCSLKLDSCGRDQRINQFDSPDEG